MPSEIKKYWVSPYSSSMFKIVLACISSKPNNNAYSVDLLLFDVLLVCMILARNRALIHAMTRPTPICFVECSICNIIPADSSALWA